MRFEDVYGNGSDGNLTIANGQTVTLPVTVPFQSIVEKQYNTINIAAGGILKCASNNAGLVIRCKGNCTINGTIDQSAKSPKPNPNNNYAYPAELTCGNGGTGGSAIFGKTIAGGAGMTAMKYGGGWSGGGAGGHGYNQMSSSQRWGGYGAEGGAANTITIATSSIFIGGVGIAGTTANPGQFGGGGAGGHRHDSVGYIPGGNGGNGAGANGVTVPAPGSGGGAGNFGGAIVLLYVGGNLYISGAILCNGGKGGDGGGLSSPNSGGSGGGGGGGGGGSIYIVHYGSYTNLGSLNVNGGAGGAGDTINKDYSGYSNNGTPGSAGTVTVKKNFYVFNQPPTTPTSLTYGTPQAGKQLSVSWGASSDPDGDAITYVVERKIDSAAFVEAGQTTARSMPVTVPASGSTITIRVKAVDSAGLESGYATGAAKAINYNRPPVISGQNGSLGSLTQPPRYTYTVTDPDPGQTVTVSEKVIAANGGTLTLRTYTAVLGQETGVEWNSSRWLSREAGAHSLVITADDGSAGTAVRTMTFTRPVQRIGAARAVATDAMPTKIFLSLYPSPSMQPGDCKVECWVTNNPFDDNPVWEDYSDFLNRIVYTFQNSVCVNGYGVAYKFSITKGAERIVFDQATLRFS